MTGDHMTEMYKEAEALAASDTALVERQAQFQFKTYRCEWQLQHGEVDQYGMNFTPYKTTPFPSRDEADAELLKTAKLNPHNGIWVPHSAKHSYCESRVVYREIEDSEAAARLTAMQAELEAAKADMRDMVPADLYTAMQADRDSWRRVAERLEGEKARAEAATTLASAAAVEQPNFIYFECPECQFSSVQKADFKGGEACPMCAGDSGHDVRMSKRTARTTDKPEGKDARSVWP